MAPDLGCGHGAKNARSHSPGGVARGDSRVRRPGCIGAGRLGDGTGSPGTSPDITLVKSSSYSSPLVPRR